ncbi:unnamed protein product [Cunninghamella blakesleeana]
MANVSVHSGHFFQSDAEIQKEQEKLAKYNYTLGDAIKLSSKALDLIIVQQGKYAFVAEFGSDAKRIHIETGKVSKAYKGHKGPVTSLALSNDGQYLWTGSWDKTIKKWDAKTGECLATLEGHSDFIKCLLVVGQHIFSGSADHHIRQWDINSYECLAVLKEHHRSVETLTISNDGLFLYSGSSDRLILKWNLSTLQVDLKLEGHDTNVTCIRMSEDDELWSASADKTVRRWNTSTGKVDTVLKHNDRVKSLVLLGPYIITGSSDDNIYVWDIASGLLKCTIEGHFDEVGCLCALGSTVYSASLDNSIRRWSVTDAALKEYNEARNKNKKKEEETKGGNELTEEEERELLELMGDDE